MSIVTCEKLGKLPSNYYDDMPITKYKAAQIIKQTKCRKKQFNSDNEYKNFLMDEYAKSYIPMVIEQCKNSSELKNFLIRKLLELNVKQ